MGLHPKIECSAEIGQQYLSIASNQKITWFDILVNETMLVYEVESGSCLLDVWYKLFGVCEAPAAIFLSEKVMDRFWRVFHHQVRSPILNLSKVIDWQVVWMLQVGDMLCLVKEATLPFFVELFGAQYFQRQYTAERGWFANFVHMAIAACAYECNHFVDTDTRSLDQKVASFTGFGFRGVFMSSTHAGI